MNKLSAHLLVADQQVLYPDLLLVSGQQRQEEKFLTKKNFKAKYNSPLGDRGYSLKAGWPSH